MIPMFKAKEEEATNVGVLRHRCEAEMLPRRGATCDVAMCRSYFIAT